MGGQCVEDTTHVAGTHVKASWRRVLPKARQVPQSQCENPELPTPCPVLTPGFPLSITLMQLGRSPRMDALGSTREPSAGGSPGV